MGNFMTGRKAAYIGRQGHTVERAELDRAREDLELERERSGSLMQDNATLTVKLETLREEKAQILAENELLREEIQTLRELRLVSKRLEIDERGCIQTPLPFVRHNLAKLLMQEIEKQDLIQITREDEPGKRAYTGELFIAIRRPPAMEGEA